MVELDKGDFLYQSDQELFLVCIGEDDDSYKFAAHGWRNISKERVEEYVDADQSKVHSQQEIEKLVEQEATDEELDKFRKLQDLFEMYEEVELDDEGPQTEFSLDEP